MSENIKGLDRNDLSLSKQVQKAIVVSGEENIAGINRQDLQLSKEVIKVQIIGGGGGEGPGLPGPPGDSAYQVAVKNGFVGTEAQWLESLKGPEGPEGPEGPQGPAGEGADLTEVNQEIANLQQAVSNKVNKDELVINVKDHGLVGDGIVDNAQALQTLMNNSAGKTLYFPSGIYKINSKVTYNGQRIALRGDGQSTVLDLSGGGSFLLSSPLQALPALSTNITAGRNVVSFATAHGLVEGDVFAVHNPTDYSWANYRTYYNDGCMFRADIISSATSLKVFGVSPDTYTNTSVNAFKLTGKGVSLEDFKIIPNATDTVIFWIDGHVGVRIKNIKAEKGATYSFFEIWRCFDVDVENLDAEVFGGDSYPLTISNSQKVTVTRSSLYSARHALALGGRSGNACVPTRDVLVNQCHLWNRSDNGVGASDIHGNCENVTYSNCYMNTGANLAGKNVKYIDCTIVGRNPDAYADGNCIYGSEIVSGQYVMENCRLITYGNGASIGTIHLDVSARKADVLLQVKNCIIENRGNSNTIRTVMVEVGSSAGNGRIDIEINGLNFKSTQRAFAFLSFSNTADVSSIASCIIDNVYSPSGVSFVVASNPANYNMPMRLQRLSGSQVITAATSTASTVGTTDTFKYLYPRQPHATVSVGAPTDKLLNGNKPILPGIYRLTASNIRPYIATGDAANWTDTFATAIMWSVGINDI